MESISESPGKVPNDGEVAPTQMDATRGEWNEKQQDGDQSERQKKNSIMKDGIEEKRVEDAKAGRDHGIDVVDMVPEPKFTDVEEKANPLG